MFKFYTILIFISLILVSCSTRMQYVGQSYPETRQVDVYVSSASIKRAYSVVGQGFIDPGYRGINWNKVQTKALKIARERGVDAVIIEQKHAVSPLPAISTRSVTDTSGGRSTTSGNTQTYFPVSHWTEVFFIKYD